MVAISQKLKSFILLALLFITTISWSQNTKEINRDHYSLLWEITKDGTPTKSYLYGTIHLKDKDLFQFPDQLVPALKSVEAFAMEVHPDSVDYEIFNELISPDYKKEIKDLLSKEQLEKLDSELELLNSKPLDSLDVFNFEIIEGLLYRQLVKDDDVDYIMDNFLYELAKANKKERFGLEKLTDQIDIVEELYHKEDSTELKENIIEFIDGGREKFFSYIKEMKRLYIAGDSEKIFQFGLDEKYQKTDFKLEERNIKMVHKMDSILKLKSLFTAVGAAHLGGKKGMVTLLKNKGYTLSPVKATFNNTEIPEIPVQFDNWQLFKETSLGYQVKIPNIPEKNTLNGDRFFNMSFDYHNEHVYMFGVIRKPVKANAGLAFIKSMVQGENAYTIKDSTFTEEITSYQAEVRNGESMYRVQTYEKFNNLYVFAALDDVNNNLYNPYINHFFESITISEPEVKPTKFELYTDSIAGFQTTYLKEFKKIQREVDNPIDAASEPYQMNIVNGVSNDDGTSYLIRYNDFPLGYFLEEETKVVDQYKSSLVDRNFVVTNDTVFQRNGKKIIQLSVAVPERAYSGKIEIYYRGNRNYMLFSLSENTTAEFDENIPFFQDFKYLPLQSKTFISKTDGVHKISFHFPSKNEITFEEDETSEFDDFIIHVGKDEGTGGCYLVSVARFRPYFYTKDLNGYIDNLITETYMAKQDSILDKKVIKNKDRSVYKYTMKSPLTNILKYYQITVKENLFISKIAYVGEEEIELDGFKKFTQPIQFPETEKFSINKSKTKKLLTDLQSTDSITFNKAKNALYYYLFDDKDASDIIDILPKRHLDDTLQYENSKNLLLQNLLVLNLTEKEIKQLKKVYLSNDLSSSLAEDILIAFPNDLEYRNHLKEMIRQLPLNEDSHYSSMIFNVFNSKKDTLPSQDVDFLLELSSRKDLKNAVFSIISEQLKKNPYLKKEITLKLPEITQDFANKIAQFQEDKKQDSTATLSYSVYRYLSIFESLDKNKIEPLQNNISKAFEIEDQFVWVGTRTLLLFIEKDLNYPEAFFNLKMEDPYSRFEIMQALIKNSKMGAIPESYLSAESFTELSAYYEVVEYYDIPKKLNKLGSVRYENRTFNAYEAIYDQAEGESFIVYTELIEPNLADFWLNVSYFDWDSNKENWKENK